jgi:two-component system chemotaxis response regulator CheB
MTRALVVDDSSFMRTVIADQLRERDVEVVGTARTGEEAVELVERLEPDVVTMDVEMPEMDGIEAVERIMASRPTPIVMLSAHTEDGAAATLDALDRGAVDVMAKPGGEVSVEMAQVAEELVRKVETAAEVDVGSGGPGRVPDEVSFPDTTEPATVIVGASTGGPRVIEDVMSALPNAGGMKVLIVQHMPPEFTAQFARRLDAESDFDVREAVDGDVLRPGEVAVAPGDAHLRVADRTAEGLHLAVDDDAPVHSVRPAIDVTMESAADVLEERLVGVLLTGLGRDGSEGARAIKRAGGTVIAQDEETAQVFGIPGRAIDGGHVDDVRPSDEVPQAIVEAVE